MSFLSILVLIAAVVGGTALGTFFLVRRGEAHASPAVMAEQRHHLALRKVELELRALEHRSHGPDYTAQDADAYAALIKRRNSMVPRVVVPPSRPRVRPVAARLA